MNKIKFSIFCFFFSFFSFAYQMLMAKIMMIEIGHEILAFCGTSAVFFYGMSLGNFRLKKYPPRDYKLSLIRSEFMMVLVACIGVNLLLFLFSISRWNSQNLDSESYTVFFNSALFFGFMTSLFLGYFAGRELTLLESTFFDKSSTQSFARLMFLSYVGAFVAGLSLVLFFVPLWGGLATIQGFALFHIILLCFLIKKPRKILVAIILLFILNIYSRNLEETYAKIGYLEFNQADVGDGITTFFNSLSVMSDISVKRIHSPYQTIDLISRTKDESFGLFLNYNYQFDSRYEQSYHSAILDIFEVYSPNQKINVLLLGAGDGLMARDLLRVGSKVDSITMVELDPVVLELAKTKPEWLKLNEHSLFNPKIEVVEGDAFSYIQNSTKTWDVVIIDFPYPTSFDVSRLYSVEFYTNLLKILNPSGFFIFDFPLRESADTIFSTLKASGVPWFMGIERGETFVVGSFQLRDQREQLKERQLNTIEPTQENTTPPNTLDKPTLPRFM